MVIYDSVDLFTFLTFYHAYSTFKEGQNSKIGIKSTESYINNF